MGHVLIQCTKIYYIKRNVLQSIMLQLYNVIYSEKNLGVAISRISVFTFFFYLEYSLRPTANY